MLPSCLAAIQIDEATVSQLCDMGFERNSCYRAVYHTKNTGPETALNWIMEHMADPGQWSSGFFSCSSDLPTGYRTGSWNTCQIQVSGLVGFFFMLLRFTNRLQNWIMEHVSDPGQWSSAGFFHAPPIYQQVTELDHGARVRSRSVV